ncbi:TetR/AcrR family transcriptional regulator [Mycobacterium sp. CBMA247]|nr:TetR/AcrR family transcriptional regulator [Mycolicibacterium sp. CBMA 329]MUL91063.1 TetR/AcrR family transcriptional regulator [Mycolicibacterium sp. CBMA 331]MUL98266.1 TetR/AcrR family transcriptional regulator [Mycolicibacterium sp. CBMA 334]MUM40822.1 TetR/AcrR family transcriptional regulator [Mycolicibacterium sp. CBMA 247]MUM47018.1 TetR/AcrR family transcriptional regulator [Mycolicibacterium sp. CBMA 294]
MEAAFSCLSEPHTGVVPIAAVLARAGLSTRAFYRHFESKDALFLAMQQSAGRSLARRLDRIADGNDGVPADQLAHWIGVAFEVIHNARSHGRATVLDSDEVRSAKGYLTAQEQWRIDRERSLAALLRRGRDDGSFPLARPERDAAAIRAVVSHELSRLRADGDWECARAAVVDFALRAVGAHTRDR